MSHPPSMPMLERRDLRNGAVARGLLANKTKYRRAQRKHTVACLRQGALQRATHQLQVNYFNQLVESGEAEVILNSVAAHRSDSQVLQYPFHWTWASNYYATKFQAKSRQTYKQHQKLHQDANSLRHNTLNMLLPPTSTTYNTRDQWSFPLQ